MDRGNFLEARDTLSVRARNSPHLYIDQMFYTREDLWMAGAKAVERAKDPAECLRLMTNITAGFDREMMIVYWIKAER